MKMTEVDKTKLPNREGKMVEVSTGTEVELLPYNWKVVQGFMRVSLSRDQYFLLKKYLGGHTGPFVVKAVLRANNGQDSVSFEVQGECKTLRTLLLRTTK